MLFTAWLGHARAHMLRAHTLRALARAEYRCLGGGTSSSSASVHVRWPSMHDCTVGSRASDAARNRSAPWSRAAGRAMSERATQPVRLMINSAVLFVGLHRSSSLCRLGIARQLPPPPPPPPPPAGLSPSMTLRGPRWLWCALRASTVALMASISLCRW
jgi:hypothetical protein